MTFAITNAPPIFQRMTIQPLYDIPETEASLDEVITISKYSATHIAYIEELWENCRVNLETEIVKMFIR